MRLPGRLRRARLTAEGPEPRCRRCGYAICESAARICPECGGDLRTLGVIARSLDRPIYPLASIIGVGVLWGAVSLIIGMVLADYIPPVVGHYISNQTLRPKNSGPLAGASEWIDVRARGRRRWVNQPPDHVWISWRRYSTTGSDWLVEATFESTDGRWHVDTPDKARHATEPNVPAVSSRLVELAGIDPQTPAGKWWGERIEHSIEQIPNPSFRTADTHNVYYGDPYGHVWICCFCVWFPVWWIVRRQVRRRWKLQRKYILGEEQATLDRLGVPA